MSWSCAALASLSSRCVMFFTKPLSQPCRSRCGGVRPRSELGSQDQVRQQRLHAHPFSCSRDNGLALSLCNVQCTRRLKTRPMFHCHSVDQHLSATASPSPRGRRCSTCRQRTTLACPTSTAAFLTPNFPARGSPLWCMRILPRMVRRTCPCSKGSATLQIVFDSSISPTPRTRPPRTPVLSFF